MNMIIIVINPNKHERGERREEARKKRSPRASLMWGVQQAQRSVDDSHNTSSCLRFLSFFWGFLVPLLSFFLSLSLS